MYFSHQYADAINAMICNGNEAVNLSENRAVWRSKVVRVLFFCRRFLIRFCSTAPLTIYVCLYTGLCTSRLNVDSECVGGG